jgi:hypothetical protein
VKARGRVHWSSSSNGSSRPVDLLVTRHQPLDVARRDLEGGVLHAQGLEDALLVKGIDRLARRSGDEHAEDLRPGVVPPLVPRLVHERQGSHPPHPLVGSMRGHRRRGSDGPEFEGGLGHQDRVILGRGQDHAEAGAEGEEVAHGDGPVRGHGIVDRSVEAPQDPAIGQFGKEPVDRLVERQPSVLHQQQRGHGRDGPRHRRDAEQGIGPQRLTITNGGIADRLDVDVAAPSQRHDDARHRPRVDVVGHRLVEAGQSLRREAASAHRSGR